MGRMEGLIGLALVRKVSRNIMLLPPPVLAATCLHVARSVRYEKMNKGDEMQRLLKGRSPYDEQVISPSIEQSGIIQTGQRYDDHGRPINAETRQRMKDHIRASNEVMLAAGVIEETADIQARDKVFEETVNRETEIGLRRLEVGRVLLVAGVWGVGGFRRRILLYKSYSSMLLLDMIRQERAQYSALHMVGTGLPALVVYQCIDWLALLGRAAISGSDESSKSSVRPKPDYKTRLLRGILDYGFGYVMLNYQMFAIIQQLNLWPSDRLLPSLRSLIPFSAHSPLQLPPLPSSFSTAAFRSWTIAFFLNIAPFGLVLAHSVAFSATSSFIYAPIYRRLPMPINLKPTNIPELTIENDYPDLDTENHDPLGAVNGESNTLHPSVAPSQHEATLQALEGRPPNHDDSSDDDDHEMSPRTLITFDVEATDTTDAPPGTWSAELRAAEPDNKDKIYRITALTMLPPLLATEGLSTVLTNIALLNLEALMVRTVARGYRRSAGLDTGDLFAGAWIPWQVLVNIFAVQTVELAGTGLLWAIYTMGSQVLERKSIFWNWVDEADKDK